MKMNFNFTIIITGDAPCACDSRHSCVRKLRRHQRQVGLAAGKTSDAFVLVNRMVAAIGVALRQVAKPEFASIGAFTLSDVDQVPSGRMAAWAHGPTLRK